MLYNRTQLEDKEEKILANYAVKSKHSTGRKHKEKFNDSRLCFQRDKDRIIHSKSFRRLDEKTQVFIAGSGDHYRTRLTHTLEVAQISRDVCRHLGLNEDLAEAIALAHDLGHPPFGHGGEEALDRIMSKYGMHFEHNQQSKKIVEELEKVYPNFDGLNLTYEVLDGLIKHQSPWDQSEKDFKISAHLEAQVVNIADEIAYTNHDMDDGLRSGVIHLKDLESFGLWKEGEKLVFDKYGKSLEEKIYISRVISSIISLMIDDLCSETERNIKKERIVSVDDVKKSKTPIASFTENMNKMLKDLRVCLYNNFYMNPDVHKFVERGEDMIRELFEYYLNNPDKFPEKKSLKNEKEYLIMVKDYIAGMTDGFLESEVRKVVGK